MGKDEIVDCHLIRKYIEKKTNEEENRLILHWLEESEDNPRYMAELMTNVSVHSVLESDSFANDTDKMLSRLNARIDSQTKPQSYKIIRNIYTTLVSAAVVILAVVLWGVKREQTQFWGGSEKQAQELGLDNLPFNCVNNSTSVRTYILSDNTKVFLKPGSELHYDVSGKQDSRIAYLNGDAYFDVAKDSLRPFIVKTESISVKVLGTAFTLSSKPGMKTSLVLERGKVRIVSAEGVNLIDLKPDQKIIYDNNSKTLELDAVNSIAYVAQHFNFVRLDQVTVAEIVRTLEKNFNVKIDFNCPQADKRYYFNYLKTDSIDDIVEVLEFISESECDIIYLNK